jgi:hypothetical protein
MANNQFRILIKSIGDAQPAASIAIAKGLNLPTAVVVSRLYSAPSILIDGIDEVTARGITKLLSGLGFEAESQDTTLPPPDAPVLYDVAIYIKDARQFQYAIEKISEFTGIIEDDAARMIMSPPGVILGSVSKATVDVLSKQLEPDISVLSSQPDMARYHLFLSKEGGETIHKRILQDLEHAELELCGTSGLVARDIDHSTARLLWQRHQASGLLRIVIQDFLHFDLVLQKSEINEKLPPAQLAPAQVEALEKIVGIPADMAEDVLRAAPITLLESIPQTEITPLMTAFAKTGLTIQANLITFQMLGLEVQSLTDPVSTQQALEGFGLHHQGTPLPKPPFVLPGVMPELQARITRAALEDTGAQLSYVEAQA